MKELSQTLAFYGKYRVVGTFSRNWFLESITISQKFLPPKFWIEKAEHIVIEPWTHFVLEISSKLQKLLVT